MVAHYILKKILQGLLVLMGVITVVFFIFYVIPGDPAKLLSGQRTDEATVKAIRNELGLDYPLYQQYFYYLNDLSPLSFHSNTEHNQKKYEYIKLLAFSNSVMALKAPYLRRSFRTNKNVTDILQEHVGGTLWLAILAIIFASIFGIIIGVFASLYQGTWIDNVLILLSVSGISLPSFVVGILLAFVFGYYLADYTGLNILGYVWDIDVVNGRVFTPKNLILPVLTLGIRPLAIIAQLTRNSMIDALSQDYIRTARAKGLSEFSVVFKHALRNAINPVITAITGWFASLLAGTFFVEKVFNWKGLGLLTINSIESKDLPVVMGATIFVAVSFVCVSIFVDILYKWADPRVQLG